MPLIWALLLGAAPHKHRLADAAERYLAGDVSSVQVFEALYAERPHDDQVATWLAVARVEAQRCAEGAQILEGRSGPRARVWQGLAALCLGDEEQGVAWLIEAWGELPALDPLRPRVAAELGWRVPLDEAADYIVAAGGVVEGRIAFEAPTPSFTFQHDGATWRWDPETRVATVGAAVEATCEPYDMAWEEVVVRGHCGDPGMLWEVLREDASALMWTAPGGGDVLLALPVAATHPTW